MAVTDEIQDAREDRAYALGMLAALAMIPPPPEPSPFHSASVIRRSDEIAAGIERAHNAATARLQAAASILAAVRGK